MNCLSEGSHRTHGSSCRYSQRTEKDGFLMMGFPPEGSGFSHYYHFSHHFDSWFCYIVTYSQRTNYFRSHAITCRSYYSFFFAGGVVNQFSVGLYQVLPSCIMQGTLYSFFVAIVLSTMNPCARQFSCHVQSIRPHNSSCSVSRQHIKEGFVFLFFFWKKPQKGPR